MKVWSLCEMCWKWTKGLFCFHTNTIQHEIVHLLSVLSLIAKSVRFAALFNENASISNFICHAVVVAVIQKQRGYICLPVDAIDCWLWIVGIHDPFFIRSHSVCFVYDRSAKVCAIIFAGVCFSFHFWFELFSLVLFFFSCSLHFVCFAGNSFII